ncbi:hypothetical protein BFP72_00760 [Reichenbachiella sp. 5M10]|uniref:DUF4230 domain-containing protein n=1 Tax=Reichenbachiella sp. 5M10 TaxID=1889772 RepID=UPI000C152413|nr:DUF4230 domain-containing protein [Reichenbachiella sp. 5M10]PIB34062.1 hypothetical protein BFP72_00760 [Reichenbachiella sp. 5M10]
MIKLLRSILLVLPWLLLVGVISWMWVDEKFFTSDHSTPQEIHQSSILTRSEQIGKLELVKYNFQEITEIKQVADYIDLKLFKYKPVPDSKAVLISRGIAVGCIDLSKITKKQITLLDDTLYIKLPTPELCHFKIDLEKSRIYDLQIDYMNSADRALFMERLYQEAESSIRRSAMDMGILDQTRENAQDLLVPLFEGLTGKKVIVTFSLPPSFLEKTP